MAWFLFAGLAAAFASLTFWSFVIHEAMIRAIVAEDPGFRPGRLDPDRGWIIKEYRRRFPQGSLSAKMQHAEWAMCAVGTLFVVALFLHRPSP